MSTAAILTAAGSGTRLGADAPKALVLLGGTPLLVHAYRRLAASGVVDLVVVTAPAAYVEQFRAALDAAARDVVPSDPESGAPASRAGPVVVTAGRATRQGSVAAALALLPPGVDVVLVHDAARALAPSTLVARVEAAVRSGYRAVIPGAPVTDTIVEVEGPRRDGLAVRAGTTRRVVANPDRAALRIVQTPQGFDRELLDRAHAAAAHRAHDETTSATDDASLVAALGEAVHVVPGDSGAAKITTAGDLDAAHLILARSVAPVPATAPAHSTAWPS